MYPQTYGTTYYGKRFPIEIEKQLSAETEGFAFLEYTKVIMLYLIAAAEGTAKFLPKLVSKKIMGEVEGTAAIVKKAVTFSLTAASEAGANITKHVILIPIFAACEAGAAIKKQVQKALQAIAEGLASIRKYRQVDFEFIGPFAPGDVVTINSRTLEVTLNGENALHLVGKDEFPKILPGEQILTFADAEGSRTVRVKIRWKDRWL